MLKTRWDQKGGRERRWSEARLRSSPVPTYPSHSIHLRLKISRRCKGWTVFKRLAFGYKVNYCSHGQSWTSSGGKFVGQEGRRALESSESGTKLKKFLRFSNTDVIAKVGKVTMRRRIFRSERCTSSSPSSLEVPGGNVGREEAAIGASAVLRGCFPKAATQNTHQTSASS